MPQCPLIVKNVSSCSINARCMIGHYFFLFPHETFKNNVCSQGLTQEKIVSVNGPFTKISDLKTDNGPFTKISDLKTNPSQKSKTLKWTIKLEIII